MDTAAADDAGDGEWQAYFGNLHSHSSVSDGVGTSAEAFAHARDTAQLNFLCLSEHNHMTTTQALGTVRQAAQQATTPTFVGLVGQEYSTISGGNHVNVFDMTDAIPKAFNTNYRDVYTSLIPQYIQANPNAIVFCQFNHPAKVDRDYGIARNSAFPNYDGDWNRFRDEAPADSNKPKTDWTPPVDAHEEANAKYLSCWKNYLERGFHLSPVADQDNHRVSWGTRTTARTGVWVKGPFNQKSLLMALKAGRTFATEDKNLRVFMGVNGAPMGSRLKDEGQRELAINVSVLDDDEPDSGYVVRLFREVVGDGEVSTDPLETSAAITNGGNTTFVVIHEAGVNECYYAEISQVGSKDNAWTAPVWIERSPADEAPEHYDGPPVALGVKFISSRNSNLYHFPDCKFVRRISAENRIEHADAPAGKQLHLHCPQEDADY